LEGFLPEDKIAHVRDTADIVDLISAYIDLKKAGKNFLGLCPFHAEKEPSFTASLEKQIFHCFGCGQGGDVFTFVMQYHNLSFPEAVRFVAQRYGIAVTTRQMSPAQKQRFQEKERLLELNREAAQYYKTMLLESPVGKRGRDYLSKRQMTPEVIDRFWLGYAPGGWSNFVQSLSCGKGWFGNRQEEKIL
jgi:DNA primase